MDSWSNWLRLCENITLLLACGPDCEDSTRRKDKTLKLNVQEIDNGHAQSNKMELNKYNRKKRFQYGLQDQK